MHPVRSTLATLLEAVSSGFQELQKASEMILSASYPSSPQVSNMMIHFLPILMFSSNGIRAIWQ